MVRAALRPERLQSGVADALRAFSFSESRHHRRLPNLFVERRCPSRPNRVCTPRRPSLLPRGARTRVRRRPVDAAPSRLDGAFLVAAGSEACARSAAFGSHTRWAARTSAAAGGPVASAACSGAPG
eukprot:124304-Chlamydomonas_euryale.AAC.2